MEDSKITENVKVPNFFYDLIVFMTPSLTLLLGIFVGLGNSGTKIIESHFEYLKINDISFLIVFVFFFIIFLFLAYEYGRLAEALSNCIGDFVRFLRRKKILFTKEKDYNINFKNEISKLNLHEFLDDDRMDKWTIYFYALRFQPAIGSDILKRYAWEKLSRSSAFTFGILFCISLILSIPKIFELHTILSYSFIDTGGFGFGSLPYSIIMLLLFFITCYEYYRRRSWNNDLLIKVLPVIALPNDYVVKRVVVKPKREIIDNDERPRTKRKTK